MSREAVAHLQKVLGTSDCCSLVAIPAEADFQAPQGTASTAEILAIPVGEAPPASIRDQKWLLVLSGVVNANQKGDNTGQWTYQTVSFAPDLAGTDEPTSTSGPLNWAIGHYSIPRPPGSVGTNYLIRFAVEEWSPFVSLSSIYDQGQSVNAGFAVNDWRPSPFATGTDVFTGQQVNNIFTGVIADIGVSDSDAWLYRLSYNITLVGKIVFVSPVIG
jgi:hypothetical protein